MKVNFTMESNPIVSVFVPYYNDVAFLKDCVQAILAQSFGDFELVLLNHASNDGSRDIAHSFTDPRIKHIDMQKNLGAGSGVLMLEFLKVAKGKYAKLFCADDIMRANCLETLVDYMQKNPQIDIAFADMAYIDKNAKPLNTKWSLQRQHFSFGKSSADALRLLFQGVGFIPYPSLIIKTDVLKTADIDKSFVMLIDMAIWVDLIIKGAKIVFLSDVIVNYRIHANQTASSSHKQIVYRRSYFESLKYCDFFYKIRNPQLLKNICPDSKFVKRISDNETRPEIFEFAIAHHYMTCGNQTYAINGYEHMHELMQNDTTRKAIEDKFNFGIREMRDIYSKPIPLQICPKEIGLGGLIYLLLRRLWIIITLKDIKRAIRNRRKFTE